LTRIRVAGTVTRWTTSREARSEARVRELHGHMDRIRAELAEKKRSAS
jgi:hypothetical protein